MTVSTELSHEEYVGNGVTTDFDFRFRIFEGRHLIVVVADDDGNETTLKNGTDYTIVGAGSYHGGKVVLNKPLAQGWKILLERDLPVVQETDLRNQGKFFAEVHEDAFDYLTMLIQKALGTFSLSLRKPTYLSNYYDAKGNRIANLAPPKFGSDSANKDYVDNSIKDIDSKTLRVKDKAIPALPNADERAGKVLTFDKDGYPIAVTPASGSAIDVINQIKNGDGSLIGTGNRSLKNKLSESISVTDFYGCNNNYHPVNNPTDSNEAFLTALDYEWVTYPAADSLSRYPKPKSTRVRIPCGSYLITDTLPVTSGLHLDFDDGVVLYFKPNSNIDLFSPPIDKMKSAYESGHKFWNDMSLYGVQITGAAVLKGNMTRTSEVHAKHAINGSNFHRSLISRLTIEGFETGIYIGRMDTSAWTGTRMGNFYNNIIDNVFIRDCKNNLINTSNLTTLINSQIGNEVLRKHDTNTGDYLVHNTGAGFTAINSNIASMMRSCNPKRGHIYDKCLGSTYTGCYSEYFDNLFVLDPDSRFGGISIDPTHLVKYPTDIVLKFVGGYMPGFDLETRQRIGKNIKGDNRWSELFSMGFRYGNSNTNLLTGYFLLAPAIDFKYGLYGVCHTTGAKMAVDIKRTEIERTGFLSNYGVRLLADEKSILYIPIVQSIYEAYVCVLYRVITGNFQANNIKLNVYGKNDYITVAEDIYDYGNGWKMATVRDVNTTNSDLSSLQIDIPAGAQVEIEHIGAYSNGVPIFPISVSYVPQVNSTSIMYRHINPNPKRYSGGQFEIGDITRPYIHVVNDKIDNAMIQNSYISMAGSSLRNPLDGTDSITYYNSVQITANDGNVDLNTDSGFQYSLGVGNYIGVTKSDGITIDSVKVVGRIYDNIRKKYTTTIKLSEVLNGNVILDHDKTRNPIFTKI